MTESNNSGRQYPTLDNVERFPTLRGWEPSVVPMPRRRKLAPPDPFFALEREHQKLFRKMRPLQRGCWAARDLASDNPRRRKIEMAVKDLEIKIDRLEDEIFAWRAAHAATPAVLIAQINMFRDWVDYRREAMVDLVIANVRALLPGGAA